MPKRSLNEPETMKEEAEEIINLRFTYKRVPIAVLEALTFEEPNRTLKEVCGLDCVKECVILQTCNRVEIYTVVAGQDLVKAESEIAEYWRQVSKLNKKDFYHRLEKSSGSEALNHLLRLASGLESMIVGEDQILGQVQEFLNEAKECGTIGAILETAFRKAIQTGRNVRLKTKINKGAVSVGSAAVDLMKETLGDLKGKKIVIVGAGETGELVGKALASRKHAVIFVANRTYERGVRLARMLGGQAVHFSKVKELLAHIDAVVVATAAPHYVLTKRVVEEVLDKRKTRKLVILDLSQPRNVEEEVANLPYIELHNIDNLRGIAEANLKARLKEFEKAETIVKSELERLWSMFKREKAEPLISAMCSRAEETRRRELGKALKIIGKLDAGQRKVIDDLTRVLVERILHYPIKNLRKAAMNCDINTISTVQELFNLNLNHIEEEMRR